MAEELKVEVRETRGKRNARRLREGGSIPAVLYGHGQESVSLAVPADELDTAVRRGSRVVTLTGAVSERAFVRELQWDTWGTHILHADFTRVFEDEKVEVEVSLELRGEAPGVKEGGVIDQVLHQLNLQCVVTEIPEKLHVNINSLELGAAITVADLELPEGVAVLDSGDAIVVQCVQPMVAEEEEGADAASAEPEVIGRKEEEEEGDGT